MKRTWYFLFFFLILSPVFGNFDLSVKQNLRSYPSGANLQSEIGYSLPLWGNHPFMGIVRVSLLGSSSLIVNGYRGKFEFFPLSFIGLYSSAGTTGRGLKELQSIDCINSNCKGAYSERKDGVKLGLKGIGLFLSGDFSFSTLKHPWIERETAYEGFNLLGRSEGDELRTFFITTGIELTSTVKLGVLHLNYKMKETSERSQMNALYLKSDGDILHLTFGAGYFKDRLGSSHPSLFAQLNWKFVKGLTLL